jgi:cell division protein FtsL
MAVLDRSRPVSLGRRVGVSGLGILAAGMVAIAALMPVAQTATTTATGDSIRRLEAERAGLQARIHQAQSELATLGALERIEREARGRLGMVPAERVIYVSTDQPAPVTGVPARYLNRDAPAASQPAERQPWWQALMGRLPRR